MSKITPLEIQNHRFSRKWKGIDPVEVESFFALVGEEIEDLTRAKAELESRLRGLEAENAEHRERERTLRDTLLSAQRASEDIRGAARKEAELIVQQAEDSSERLTHHALQRSAEIEKAIEDLKLQRARFRLEVQKLIDLVGQVLEMDRREDEKDRPLSYMTRKEKGETG
ncbi:MAG TPA: DivIVA domain-containing protein [Thermoanaerobaculia bacterium]|jgi:cell division initiation protein|nr:DivIVA domain-containing protein [Thermoanaerobaculia bacterium]